MIAIHKAQKSKAKLRMAITGAAGSGKTFTALTIATTLGKKVLVLDTEGGETGSANKYADLFDFDHAPITDFRVQTFIEGIKEAERLGYDVLVIDSLSHAWMGQGGVLDQADRIAKQNPRSNSFQAWKEATPLHRSLIDAILRSKVHVICTIRSKMDYVMEEVERQGRKIMQPKKIGMAPIQRDDVPYEFDIVGDMDSGTMVISKTRCHLLTDEVIKHPGKELAAVLGTWLETGVDPQQAPPEAPQAPQAAIAAPEIPQPPPEPEPAPLPEPEPEPEPAPQPQEKPDIKTRFFSQKMATELDRICTVVQHSVQKKHGNDYKFTMDNTREWIGKTFGLTSHTQLNAEQYEALLSWLRRCNRAGEVVE